MCHVVFDRRDSFITHRAFCDALAEESAKANPQAPGSGLAAALAEPNSKTDLKAGRISPPPIAAAPPPVQSTSVVQSSVLTDQVASGKYLCPSLLNSDVFLL